ncbi:MAG TPA: hypothetical protein VJL29_04320 [Thermoguttaceae bacterium]|nr:hypothetical protein [Thermoguttaceae bacterium]
MKVRLQPCCRAIAVFVVLLGAATVTAGATATLEAKRFDAARSVYPPTSSEWMFQLTAGQNVTMNVLRRSVKEDGKTRIVTEERKNDPRLKQFAEAVQKEPDQYNSELPFRGVFRLGDKRYGFVFDAVEPGGRSYGVLYLDRNGNGDLTDDEAIESNYRELQQRLKKEEADAKKAKAEADMLAEEAKADPTDQVKQKKAADQQRLALAQQRRVATMRRAMYSAGRFPRIDMQIEIDGQKTEYSFFFQVYSSLRPTVRLYSAQYYEGRIELDGKTHRVVLVDYDCNGRFDDPMTLPKVGSYRDANVPVYAVPGDRLFVDPKMVDDYRLVYDRTGPAFQHNVGKWLCFDGRCWNLNVSPAGNRITIEPSEAAVGRVANANQRYTALVHGEQGVLKIQGTADQPAALPVGKWSLLSYLIDLTDAKADEKADAEAGDAKPAASARSRLRRPLPKSTFVSAMATGNAKPVEIVEGQTVEMLFGEPFTATVQAQADRSSFLRVGTATGIAAGANITRPKQDRISLSLNLSGAGGEKITGITVNGQRPGKPTFKILDPEGKVVQEGNFEYG